MAPTRKKTDTITRRDLAGALGLHPDSVSRNLHRGLAGAVVEWGGRGRETTFSFAQALRWYRAWQCRQRNEGQPCYRCRTVLEDMEGTGEHLREARHGFGQCPECRADWPVMQPCGAGASS